MLSIFKKIFGKSEPKAVVVRSPVAPVSHPSAAMPTIEVAHLSLAAIVARFPEDLKPLLLREPDAAATVALPLPTILKQLPTGSVRMSLASLHRQAHGLIKPLPPGDKRSVEVPLAEVFRHVRPDAFKRRSDQRVAFVPEDGFNLFGDSSNPFAVAPDNVDGDLAASAPEPQVLDLTPDLAQATPRVLKMDFNLQEHGGNGASAAPHVPPPSPSGAVLRPPPDLTLITPERTSEAPAAPVVPAAKPSSAAPKSSAAIPAATTPAVPVPVGPTQAISLVSLSADWPEEIRAEIAGFDPETTVALPVNDVTAALARGRVIFSWAQIHAWLQPPAAPTAVPGDVVLKLPLKVIAPAFLPATRKPERKSRAVDTDIPALFTDGRPPTEKPAVEEPAVEEPPAAELAPEVAPAAKAEPIAPEAAAPARVPETVGEIFGQAHKRDWTPSEIVAGTVTLPGVAGAIVALQEGLQVSASLPEGVKSEVVAAFLPQIFARLNQYAGEMRLGDVDDLLFTTHGAHCQIYRLGYIYFAVLGKAGESLPWHELRLITEELARQTHK
jgi:predicted regulator of Ras-like GTPase activity (Roadblock/LC7/MglB family)